MRISGIKASNILSFPYIENFETSSNTIDFKEDLNILIGANGSGKSNLLEIINKLFQTHFFKSYFIDDNVLFYGFNTTTQKAIRLNTEKIGNVSNTLHRHYDTKDKKSEVQVSIIPDAGDIINLLFLFENFSELGKFSKEYCEDSTFFEDYKITSDYIERLQKIDFKFTVSVNNNRISLDLIHTFENSATRFFYNYLVFFNQIQLLIETVNRYKEKDWRFLKNPFALISSMRTYGGYNNSISIATGINNRIKEVDQSDANQSAKNYTNTEYIFQITSLKLGQQIRFIRDGESGGVQKGMEHAQNNHNSLLYKINSVIGKQLGLKLKLENYNGANDTLMLNIYRDTQAVNFSDLSMGQKSIFYLLFAVYGYNIENGLLVIDEPELHLHISMQKKYFDILKSVCKDANIQIIIATHSSIFIDENTIKNTFRFSKENNNTSIVFPANIQQEQKDLIKILTYTNSSRIFFSDHVLLVEGDSDEYFFRFFYENFIQKEINHDKSIEIIYIGGKGNFEKWREFLKLFKINTFFIGDFDNIKEYGIPGKVGISFDELTKKSKEQIIGKLLKEKIKKNGTKDGRELLRQVDLIVSKNFELNEQDKEDLKSLWIYLTEKQGIKKNHIIDYLKEGANPTILVKIISEIEGLYSDGIFILKQGDLEDYLKISKDLSNVILFCQIGFDAWVSSQIIEGKTSNLNELRAIFSKILTN